MLHRGPSANIHQLHWILAEICRPVGAHAEGIEEDDCYRDEGQRIFAALWRRYELADEERL